MAHEGTHGLIRIQQVRDRASSADDDQVLAAMMPMLDALYTAFGEETP